MSDERPLSEHGARSSQDGPVPGQTAVEVDREIQFRQLVWLGGGLVAVAMLAGLVVFFLLRSFLHAEQEAAGPPPPMVAAPPVVAGPQLLARPEGELARVRELENEQIDSYGWVDAGQGLVRIPIERAVEIAAAKGLPSRPVAAPGAAAPGAAAAGTAAPGTAEPGAVPQGTAAAAGPGLGAPASPGGAVTPAPQGLAPQGHAPSGQATPAAPGAPLQPQPAPTPTSPGAQQ